MNDDEWKNIIAKWRKSDKRKKVVAFNNNKIATVKQLDIFEDIVNAYLSPKYLNTLIDDMEWHNIYQKQKDCVDVYTGRIFMLHKDLGMNELTDNVKSTYFQVQVVEDIAMFLAVKLLCIEREDYILAKKVKEIQTKYVAIMLLVQNKLKQQSEEEGIIQKTLNLEELIYDKKINE